MCGLKLEIIFLFMCGFIHVSMSAHAKKELVKLVVKKNVELKNNLRDGIITTSTQETVLKCICSKVYDPVCGSNNKSYYNICQLQCENKPGTVSVLHQGNCIPFRKNN